MKKEKIEIKQQVLRSDLNELGPEVRVNAIAPGPVLWPERDLDAAERGYRAALDAAPGHPYATHYLGVVDYQRGRPAEALPRLFAAAAQRRARAGGARRSPPGAVPGGRRRRPGRPRR